MSEFKTDPTPISLTTDFGTSDWFIGVMKGVICSINPNMQLIDITHHISPGNIQEAAFVLKQAVPWFPKKTIHLAVVDPGVGTSRNGLIIETENSTFVGPDNGIFSWALLDTGIVRIIRLNPKNFSDSASHTFHGRDLFAPAAARLSMGENALNLGEATDSLIQLEWPDHVQTQDGIQGQIMHVDRFGNLITNIPIANIPIKPKQISLQISEKTIPITFHSTYDQAATNALVLIPASTGYFELAVKGASAASKFDWSARQRFELVFGN
jgi:S-adenosyl-L-methionine hydrolase (adenosine-forming)